MPLPNNIKFNNGENFPPVEYEGKVFTEIGISTFDSMLVVGDTLDYQVESYKYILLNEERLINLPGSMDGYPHWYIKLPEGYEITNIKRNGNKANIPFHRGLGNYINFWTYDKTLFKSNLNATLSALITISKSEQTQEN